MKPGKAKVRCGRTRAWLFCDVTVGPASERLWDFAKDVVPILTRSGCNTGGCHGKADGQNGFHLSLFGYDPEGDYQAVTRDASGRRVSRVEPE